LFIADWALCIDHKASLQTTFDAGDAAVKSLLGWKFDSPRGPIMIDPETRDIVMNEYLDEVVKGADGKLYEKVLETIPNVKDECKALAIGPCAPK
jgi:branched-chain amino acid transport system substrate-binding protein